MTSEINVGTVGNKPFDVVVIGGVTSISRSVLGRGKSRFIKALMESPDHNVTFLTPEEYNRPKSIDQYIIDEHIIDEEFTTLPKFEDKSFSYMVDRRKPKPYWLQKQRW